MSSIRPTTMRHLGAAAVVTFVGGCSLLYDSTLTGHPCGADSTCLAGYACNRDGLCVEASQAACPAACGPLEACVQQQCVKQCAGLACTPGYACFPGPSGAECVLTAGGQALGAACLIDADCGGAPLFCLTTVGIAGASGVCTELCDPSGDVCATAGETCKDFPSDPSTGRVSLCAQSELTPCTSDAQCNASGLVCEVMYVPVAGSSPDAGQSWQAATACGAPVAAANAVLPGSPCDVSTVEPCRSGLCVVVPGGGEGLPSRVCSTPCSQPTDCLAFGGSGLVTPSCEPVSIAEQTGTPIVRALLCIGGGATVGTDCTANAAVCGADAPECVPSMADPSKNICAPYCVTGPATCVSEGHTLTCDTIGINAGTCY